jgi:hypothetical protein
VRRRITCADNRRGFELDAVGRRRKEMDAIAIRMAEERRAREDFYDQNPHWKD